MANQVIKIKKYIHPFERILSIFAEDIVLEFKEFPHLPWDDFLLNPRRLRGSDFLMRWSQGVWSEHRLTQSINEQTKFYAIPYGPSSAAPHNNVREFELYFERLEEAGLGKIKRPDLLIFNKSDKDVVDRIVKSYGQAKIITGTNVFAHLYEIDDVVRGMKYLLEKEGVIVFMEKFKVNKGYIISLDKEENGKIEIVPAFKFLLGNS